MLVSTLGWALAFRSAIGVLLTALMILPLLARIRSEETLLHTQFGAEYDAYRTRTAWRLISRGPFPVVRQERHSPRRRLGYGAEPAPAEGHTSEQRLTGGSFEDVALAAHAPQVPRPSRDAVGRCCKGRATKWSNTNRRTVEAATTRRPASEPAPLSRRWATNNSEKARG